jgi:hypothetical protein
MEFSAGGFGDNGRKYALIATKPEIRSRSNCSIIFKTRANTSQFNVPKSRNIRLFGVFRSREVWLLKLRGCPAPATLKIFIQKRLEKKLIGTINDLNTDR